MKNKLRWIVRSLYFVLVATCVYSLWINISDAHISCILILKWIILSAICNSGLWIITTEWAKKWKWLSLFLFLPILLILPLLLPLGSWMGGWFGAMIYFALMSFILVVYFPWRKNDLARYS